MSITKRQSKGGVYYEIRVQVSGQRAGETFRGTLKQARAIETQLRKELTDAAFDKRIGKAPKRTFGQACIKWGEQAPKSMHSHIRQALVHLKDDYLTDLVERSEEVKELYLAQGLSPLTINRRLAVVKRVLNLAYRQWGWLDYPLAEKIIMLSEKNTARQIRLTREQSLELLEAFPRQETRDVANLALNTGLRRNELFNLEKGDFKDGMLHIRRSKGGNSRHVPVPRHLHGVCNDLPLKITYNQLRADFEHARDIIGMSDLWFHDLRHTYATWMISSGKVDAATVRDLLGHATIATTNKYVHSVNFDIDEVLG